MKKNRLNFPKKSFTLLEMLVVIGIVAILIGMATVSYSTAQKKARDSKRKSDLKTIQNALEQYYSVCGYQYPTPQGNSFNNIYCPNPTQGILPTAPVDPKNITPYPCNNCSSSGYTICAQTETEPTPCVTNQQ